MALLPVNEAQHRIVADVAPLRSEVVPIAESHGRILAEEIVATRDQPPFPASAMDGYAVRAADTTDPARLLRVVGTSAAGHAYSGTIGPGEAVRIFTGAPVPDGADAILIQEDALAEGTALRANEAVPKGRHIRPAGLDFPAGQPLLSTGIELGLGEIALAAAAGRAAVRVRCRPLVAVLATGDELVPPGGSPSPDQIFASTGVAIAAHLTARGADARNIGIAADNLDALGLAIDRAADMRADLLITIGGVSVGDHDLVQRALADRGMSLDFWKIAMRPGKPLMFGRLGPMRVIGLPGNPVSSVTTLTLFVLPLIAAFLGLPAADDIGPAVLGTDMPANGVRADYLRARITGRDVSGLPVVTPLPVQDSSQLSVFVKADCLIVRPVEAPAASAGDTCEILRLR